MTLYRKLQVLVLFGAGLLAMSAHAALPLTLADGTELPSLAPMLERATPAVVNIATSTRVRQRNPLLEDPFFAAPAEQQGGPPPLVSLWEMHEVQILGPMNCVVYSL